MENSTITEKEKIIPKQENIFIPSFKENGNDQYYFEDGDWIKCGEDQIDSLWKHWIQSDGAKKVHQDGFTIFGNDISTSSQKI